MAFQKKLASLLCAAGSAFLFLLPAQRGVAQTFLLREQGSLNQGDSIIPRDGSFYDEYSFQGEAGETVTILLTSSAFDPYLILFGPDEQVIDQNDDISRNNLNSSLTVTLPATGTYTVVANSYEAGETGAYSLQVSSDRQAVAQEEQPVPSSSSGSLQVPASGVPPESTANPELAEAIRSLYPDALSATYQYNYVDLNNDGSSEVIAFFQAQNYCGTCGCVTLIFDRNPQGYHLLNEITCSGGRILVLQQTHNGWSDLAFQNNSGYGVMRFDGQVYQGSRQLSNSNRIVGTQYFSDAFSREGISLAAEEQDVVAQEFSNRTDNSELETTSSRTQRRRRCHPDFQPIPSLGGEGDWYISHNMGSSSFSTFLVMGRYQNCHLVSWPYGGSIDFQLEVSRLDSLTTIVPPSRGQYHPGNRPFQPPSRVHMDSHRRLRYSECPQPESSDQYNVYDLLLEWEFVEYNTPQIYTERWRVVCEFTPDEALGVITSVPSLLQQTGNNVAEIEIEEEPSSTFCDVFEGIREYRATESWWNPFTYLSYITGAIGLNDAAEIATGLVAGNLVDCPAAEGYDLDEITNITRGLTIALMIGVEEGSIQLTCNQLRQRGVIGNGRPTRPQAANKKRYAAWVAEMAAYETCGGGSNTLDSTNTSRPRRSPHQPVNPVLPEGVPRTAVTNDAIARRLSRRRTRSADEENRNIERDFADPDSSEPYHPPFTPGTEVNIYRVEEPTYFVRFSGGSSMPRGNFMMRLEDIRELTPHQIRDRFALPPGNTMDSMSLIRIKEGAEVLSGSTNRRPGWGLGGGQQYLLNGRPLDFIEVDIEVENW